MEEERKKAEAAAKAEEEKKKRLEEGWELKKEQWEQDKKEIKNKAIQDQSIGKGSKDGHLGNRKPDDKLVGGDTGPLAHVGEGSETGQEEAAVNIPSQFLKIQD